MRIREVYIFDYFVILSIQTPLPQVFKIWIDSMNGMTKHEEFIWSSRSCKSIHVDESCEEEKWYGAGLYLGRTFAVEKIEICLSCEIVDKLICEYNCIGKYLYINRIEEKRFRTSYKDIVCRKLKIFDSHSYCVFILFSSALLSSLLGILKIFKKFRSI